MQTTKRAVFVTAEQYFYHLPRCSCYSNIAVNTCCSSVDQSLNLLHRSHQPLVSVRAHKVSQLTQSFFVPLVDETGAQYIVPAIGEFFVMGNMVGYRVKGFSPGRQLPAKPEFCNIRLSVALTCTNFLLMSGCWLLAPGFPYYSSDLFCRYL